MYQASGGYALFPFHHLDPSILLLSFTSTWLFQMPDLGNCDVVSVYLGASTNCDIQRYETFVSTHFARYSIMSTCRKAIHP